MNHFSNNGLYTAGGRLFKINPLFDVMNKQFWRGFLPSENICVGETSVPFRGRILLRKEHTYGLKLYKVCVKGAYIYIYNAGMLVKNPFRQKNW